MAANGKTILVLYRVVNSETDSSDLQFNCFRMPFGNGPTLAAVKQHCVAAHSLSHLGPEGYHWRVLVEDKLPSGSTERTYSWWDVQDSNAKLPVKQTTQYELRKLLFPPSKILSSTDSATKAAKGAFKMMGKAVAAVAGDDSAGADHGPPVAVLAFKLLDLVRVNDDFNLKRGIAQGMPSTPAPQPAHVPAPARYAPPTPHRPASTPQARTPAPPRPAAAAYRPQQSAPPRQQYQQPTPARQPQRQQEASLMDFGDAPAPAASKDRVLHHTTSSPASFSNAVPANESRAEKLKRQYAQKKQQSNRVWDDVDQRWVEVKPGGSVGNRSAPSGSSHGMPKKKEQGISLDSTSAIGKSANVQAAVNKRVKEMQDSQAKALQEVREREAAKKRAEEEEDVVRKQLEPRIKAWSEEHGKKKQLRALLASLHTVLWPGTKWKQITIGDLLNDSKVKKFYHKATLIVHPDKTGHLPADQRFLAKRVFDALTQAWTEFNDGSS